MAALGLVGADWPEVALWSVVAGVVALWSVVLGVVELAPAGLVSLAVGG